GSHLRRRRTSLPDILDNTPLKRLRLNDPAPIQNSLPTALNQGCCPTQDPIRDEAYRQRVLEEFQSAEDGLDSWGRRTNDLVAQILQKSKPPIRGEAYFLNGEGAFQQAELGRVDIPIFTQSQQPFQWRGKDRPVSQFFNRMEDIGLNRTVSVQIPSHPLHKASCERKTLLDVRDRFLLQRLTNNPWNLLDLQSPIPSALPSFLEGENCQLLLRIRDAVLMGNSAERIAAPAQDWNTWRNVTDWALLSEGAIIRHRIWIATVTRPGLRFRKGVWASGGCPDQDSRKKRRGCPIHITLQEEIGDTSSFHLGIQYFFPPAPSTLSFGYKGNRRLRWVAIYFSGLELVVGLKWSSLR
ncbi:hypothetical protein B0T26DRAFT_436955, partial [Lasiosphaeria miniovina]